VAAAATILAAGITLWARLTPATHEPHIAVDSLLRADGLSVCMLIVIGVLGMLSCIASIGYLDHEMAHGHTTPAGARRYGTFVCLFLAAMSVAVQANNLGVLWAAIEATTIATAFLVGHRRTRDALEATWKYVVICSSGIAFAFLGTVLLYDAARHAGAGLDFTSLTAHAAHLDPHVTRLAAGLLLLGYGAKAGLVPLHTWLADAHSQAPAPVSALMSGVLLAVAFTALLRIKAVLDPALGTGYLRTGLLITGLATIAVAAAMLIAQRDLKRLLAYSSMENMGLVAIAAAAGTRLAVTALLLHVVAHGLAKTVLFLAAGQLQASHATTAINDITAVLARSRGLGSAFTLALVALVGLPPFALFASELSIARALADAHLAWALGVCVALVLIAYAALLAHGSRILLGGPDTPADATGGAAPIVLVPVTLGVALVAGVAASLALGLTAGPFTALLHSAATVLGTAP
jgi:hydrogenase-4 component F